jgi:hypothetical protein
MHKLIISIIIGILIYIIFQKEKEKENFGRTGAIKCFLFDPYLVYVHDLFVDVMSVNPDMRNKVIGKLLPAICILDMVINKKPGWDKFVDSQGKKFETDRIGGLTKYLEEQNLKAIKYMNDNNLSFLNEYSNYKTTTTNPLTELLAHQKKEYNPKTKVDDIVDQPLNLMYIFTEVVKLKLSEINI